MKKSRFTEEQIISFLKQAAAGMPKPDARTAIANQRLAFEHYNEHYPHSALKYRSPREFRQLRNSPNEG